MSDEEPDADEDAMTLVRLAGPRPLPTPEATAEARAFVHAAWRAGVRRRRLRATLLLAAGLAAAVLTALAVRDRVAPRPRIAGAPTPASVAHLDVGLLEREGESGWTPLGVGAPLPAGSRMRTGPRGAALRVEDGRSVRLAPRSRLVWAASDRVTLEAGAVYVDSGRAEGRPARPSESDSFEVVTPWGGVREAGTQFEVRLQPSALRVRVREGRVAVSGRGSTHDVPPGAELRLDAAGPRFRPIESHGAEWSWVLALAPAFDLEGRSLDELLAWASHEAGWTLRYADDETRRRSASARLHGSIAGLRPDEAAAAVIPSTGLSHRIRDGVLWIGPSGE